MLTVSSPPWCCKWSLYSFPYLFILKKFLQWTLVTSVTRRRNDGFCPDFAIKEFPSRPASAFPSVFREWFFMDTVKTALQTRGRMMRPPRWLIAPTPPSILTYTFSGFKPSYDSISIFCETLPQYEIHPSEISQKCHPCGGKHIKL